MRTDELSTCFCTSKIAECRAFYETHMAARPIFDCGWYVNLRINGDGPTLQFIEPRDGMPEYAGAGVMLNFKVDDVDAEYKRLTDAGLGIAMPLEDHPWGDRGFSVIDPIGNSVYIHSDCEPSPEFKRYYVG